jgi:hypothetical protein
MEQNVTRYLQIVGSPSAGFTPKPGFDLVVLRHSKSGLEFDSVISNGKQMEQGSFFSRIRKNDHSYVCYVVSASPSIRHTFNSPIEHMSHGHSFELDYTLLFAVGNPRLIVERINDDPVRQVETEVKRIIDSEARKIPWEKLIENVLNSAGEELTNEILTRQRSQLEKYAEQYGIRLNHIAFAWRLSREEAEPYQVRSQVERKQQVVVSQANLQLTELDTQHTIEEKKASHKETLDNYALRSKLKETVAEVLGNVGDNIHTGEAFVHQYQALTQPGSPFYPGPGPSGHALPPGIRSGALPAGAPEIPTIQTALDEAVMMVDSLNSQVQPPEKRKLLASIVHLVAECYLGESANPTQVESYSESIDRIGRQLRSLLTEKQLMYLHDTLNFESLKRKLQ